MGDHVPILHMAKTFLKLASSLTKVKFFGAPIGGQTLAITEPFYVHVSGPLYRDHPYFDVQCFACSPRRVRKPIYFPIQNVLCSSLSRQQVW